jgi:hypothetical protein
MKRFANTFLLCPVAFGAGTLARVPNEMGRPGYGRAFVNPNIGSHDVKRIVSKVKGRTFFEGRSGDWPVSAPWLSSFNL